MKAPTERIPGMSVGVELAVELVATVYCIIDQLFDLELCAEILPISSTHDPGGLGRNILKHSRVLSTFSSSVSLL